MAIDFLIFALLFVSFLINLLALAAFWITPGLRTTANRFTINLLIINLIGCLILAPTLFLNSDAITGVTISSSAFFKPKESDDSIELYTNSGSKKLTVRHNGQVVEEEGIITDGLPIHNSNNNNNNQNFIETLYKRNSTFYQELTINESSDTIVITEFEEQQQQQQAAENPTVSDLSGTLSPKAVNAGEFLPPPLPAVRMRCWSIDMAAALGALAVLLVVGDTWCAVTDPLRYHSRISGVKAWIFIALTWIMGILFGALSAFRTLDFESDTFLSRKRQRLAITEAYYSLYTSNGIFEMAFACIYFVVIILLPFGFVCGMYWRIFSEARENGLRMRQNGSSPLLQSALNLTQHQQPVPSTMQPYANLCMHRNSISSASSSQGYGGGGGLQMQIDQRKASPASMRRDSAAKVLLPTISDDGASGEVSEHGSGHLMTVPEQQQQQQQQQTSNTLADRNQNILLTLQSASGEIKRNYSARQLPLLGMSSQDLADAERLKGIRQVHSSPNLHKYTEMRQDSLSDETTCSVHLLGYNQMHSAQLQRQHHNAVVRHQHYHQQHLPPQNRRHSHALQIPAVHASPKTLGYMSSLRHRLSNASSLFKYREESRAARISILVVFMFLVSYLPYGFLVLLQSRLPAANFERSSQLAIFMILLGNLSSPFIFAYRNKRVRRGVKRLFGIDAHHAHERSFHSQGGGGAAGGAGISGGSLSGRNRPSPAIMKRNSSKVSTYSLNSCKYITPQSSLASNDGVAPVQQLRSALRPNASCSTIINFMLTKHSGTAATAATAAAVTNEQQSEPQYTKVENGNNVECANMLPQHTTTMATTTLVTSSKLPAPKPRNLFKFLFRSSQNLGRSVKSCAQGGNNNEPVEV